MSTTTPTPASPEGTDTPAGGGTDRAQYGLAALVAAIGGYILYDATRLGPAFSDQPVQPSAFPYVVGGALVVLAAVLAVATWRGDAPHAEEGEDVDLSVRSDWRTVGLLVVVFGLNVALIDVLGWAITGAFLFAGTAWVLGNRRIVLNLVIGAVLSVGTWYGFYVGLGVPIPAGILDGVL
jgi:putative tricarboxylic transport membrane protein